MQNSITLLSEIDKIDEDTSAVDAELVKKRRSKCLHNQTGKTLQTVGKNIISKRELEVSING